MESSQRVARLTIRVLIIASIAFSIYLGSFGLMRWRKVLVRVEVREAKEKGGPVRYSIRDGHDARMEGIGAFKNGIAKPVAVFFGPACWAEAYVWNRL
jgi:hypothetical protein